MYIISDSTLYISQKIKKYFWRHKEDSYNIKNEISWALYSKSQKTVSHHIILFLFSFFNVIDVRNNLKYYSCIFIQSGYRIFKYLKRPWFMVVSFFFSIIYFAKHLKLKFLNALIIVSFYGVTRKMEKLTEFHYTLVLILNCYI